MDLNKTNHNANLIRFLACNTIILLHITGFYVIKGYTAHNFGIEFWFVQFINTFCRVGTPVFLMIAGRFLLAYKEHFIKFYYKRFFAVMLPGFVWIIVYSYYNKHVLNLSTEKIRQSIISGFPFAHLWYLYMLIGLYAITPLLQYLMVKLNKKRIFYLGISFLFGGIILEMWYYLTKRHYFYSNTLYIYWFLPYLGYYLLGHGLEYLNGTFSNKRLLQTIILLTIISTVLSFNFYNYHNKNTFLMSRISPFVALSSICVYVYFFQLKIKKSFFSQLAPYTLIMYLAHAGILDFLSRKLFWRISLHSVILDVFVHFIIVATLTLIVSILLSKIFNFKKFFRSVINIR